MGTMATQILDLPARGTGGAPAGGTITFIGNATVLVRHGPITFLTDPTFVHMHEKVSIGYGMHTERLTNPAMDVADLPPLDFILLSHFHGDHFDQVAEEQLDATLPVVSNPQSAMLLNERRWGNTYRLHRWESLDIRKEQALVRVTAMPGRHGPPVVDFALPDVMGSLVEFEDPAGGRPFRLYISGDTLVFDDLREIPERFPDIDLALLHLGGTKVLGIMVTMDAEQGMEAMGIVGAGMTIPIHFDDYDVFTSPLSDFSEAADAAGLSDRVFYLKRGDTYTFGGDR